MISYAQNFEDVMLWRALKHVKNGFYVDVGAWSPDNDSVTKFFYENGWHGINIEPNSDFNAEYAIKRQRDINLNVAVGEKKGTLTIHFLNSSGLSTANKDIAKQFISEGLESYPKKVKTETLANIFHVNIPQGQEIHFLKVDVEGMEEAVLKGNNWILYKPWILIVESTLPVLLDSTLSVAPIESCSWESFLINKGYTFVYADGLNRFYVVNERPELCGAFKYPPNVFDSFLISSQKNIEAKAKESEAKMNLILSQLDAIKGSKSWRITKPLRWMSLQISLLTQNGFKSRLKFIFFNILKRLVLFIESRPKLKIVFITSLKKFGIYSKVKKIFDDFQFSTSPRASYINYEDLISVRLMKDIESLMHAKPDHIKII